MMYNHLQLPKYHFPYPNQWPCQIIYYIREVNDWAGLYLPPNVQYWEWHSVQFWIYSSVLWYLFVVINEKHFWFLFFIIVYVLLLLYIYIFVIVILLCNIKYIPNTYTQKKTWSIYTSKKQASGHKCNI